MPPVSQKQRGAMYEAAEGKSSLGIPQSVGREFVAADPGGKLPMQAHPATHARLKAAMMASTLHRHPMLGGMGTGDGSDRP